MKNIGYFFIGLIAFAFVLVIVALIGNGFAILYHKYGINLLYFCIGIVVVVVTVSYIVSLGKEIVEFIKKL